MVERGRHRRQHLGHRPQAGETIQSQLRLRQNHQDGNLEPITSYYDILAAADSGLMRANTPWSGNYQVAPAVWAAAHTAQFAFPGWTYLEGGASALLPSGGSIVTLESTNHSDYSVIVETFDATAGQMITFHPTNGLSAATLNVWQTTQTNWFIKIGPVTPAGGAFTYTFQIGRASCRE